MNEREHNSFIVMEYMKTRHGLKKFKCNFCDYRSNDRKTLKGHENNKHMSKNLKR